MRREAISHSERHEAANNSCLKASVDILWRFTYFSYALFFIGSSSTRHIEEGGGKKKKKNIRDKSRTISIDDNHLEMIF